MARYAYIHTQIWKDKKFRQLSESARMLYLAALTAPNSNMIGYYEWPVAYALHDLGGWTEEKFFACIGEIEKAGMAAYDRENEIIFIRNFLKHNPLTSIKQITGGANYIRTIPNSPLYREFFEVWGRSVDTPFRENLSGKDDESTKKLTGIIDRIARENAETLEEIEREYPVDTHSSNAAPAQDTLSSECNNAKNTVSIEHGKAIDTVPIPNAYPTDSLSDVDNSASDTLSIPYRYPIDNPVPGHGHIHGHIQKNTPPLPGGGGGGLDGPADNAPPDDSEAVPKPQGQAEADLPAEKASDNGGGARSENTNGKEEPYLRDFETFYSAYPRKVQKRPAFKAWQTLRRQGAQTHDLLNAAAAYQSATVAKGTPQDKIMHPATFLHEDRWRDWLPPDGASYLEARGLARSRTQDRGSPAKPVLPRSYEEAEAMYGGGSGADAIDVEFSMDGEVENYDARTGLQAIY